MSDFFMIASLFNIPKDIIETMAKGSTYENQEKAMARFVEYALMPKAQKLTDWFETQFSFQDLRMSWSHLMFNQVFEKDRADKVGVQIDNILKAKEAGAVTESDAKKMISNLLNG